MLVFLVLVLMIGLGALTAACYRAMMQIDDGMNRLSDRMGRLEKQVEYITATRGR